MIFQQDIEYNKIDDLIKTGMAYAEQLESATGMLKLGEIDPFFLDFVKKNNLGTKISNIGIHIMKPGSSSPYGHLHAKARCVFYIQAPEGVGSLLFPDLNITIKPHKGLLVVVPAKVNHAMSENKSDEVRIVFAFYVE